MKSTHTAPRVHVCGIYLTALATLGLGLALSPARAANPDPAYTQVAQRVQYGDLNLASRAGIAQLYQRIEAASTEVCTSDSSNGSLAEWSRSRACAEDSASRAVAQIDNVALTAFYTKKTGLRIDRRRLLAKR